MSTETLQQRPIFGSEEQNLLSPIRPPVSRLSICSLILGLISSLALFNLDLMALPVLSAAVGLAAYLLTAKNDAVSGQNLSLVGMGLSIIFGMACFTSNKQRDNYLYREGGKVAEQFLKIVGENKLLEAFELTRLDTERQVAGSSLEESYEAAAPTVKETIDGFRQGDGIRKVVALGPSAQWKFDAGLRTFEAEGSSLHVTLRMIDSKSQKSVEVTMNRYYEAGSGHWNVMSVK